ncbi:MAG: hypothetical protein JNL60_09100 [Bacteroidia bacterium]|nr:hypothetical protein [Bacteroidia bacterium]
MSKTKWLIIFLLLFAFLGYTREFFFVHLNVIMFEKYYNRVSEAPFPEIMNVFRVFSYDTLYYSKYAYTVLWTLIYFAANFYALKKLTHSELLLRILKYSYLVMIVIAVISMAYGYILYDRLQDDEYTLSRWLMGIAQSPIICLILLASEKLYNKSFKYDQEGQ